MRSAAYIATLIYLPLIVVYMLFGNPDYPIWDKFYFIIEKGLLCALLYSLASKEIINNRRIIYFIVFILQVFFILYILVDWSEAFVMDNVALWIASSLVVLALLISFLYHDRKK